MREADWSKVLGWPGYRVYRQEIDEPGKRLKLWVRRKRGNRKLICSGCGRKLAEANDSYEREVRDLPCFEFRTTVVVELYRVRCPDCGVKTEKVPQLPSKAPFSKRFEEAVGLACESAAVRRVARQFGLASSTVRAIDVRYLSRWSVGRRKPALRQPAEGEPLTLVGLQLRRSHVALSAEMDRPVALAAAETHGEASRHVAGSSRGHLELLPDEGTDGCGRSRQRQHQSSAPSRPWLSRHELPAAEGAALGRHKDRIRGFSESRVECALLQIVVQNRFFVGERASGNLIAVEGRPGNFPVFNVCDSDSSDVKCLQPSGSSFVQAALRVRLICRLSICLGEITDRCTGYGKEQN